MMILHIKADIFVWREEEIFFRYTIHCFEIFSSVEPL